MPLIGKHDSNNNTSFSFLFFFHFLPVVWGHAWAEHYSSHDGAKLSGSRTLGMTPEVTHSLSLKRRNVISVSLCGWGRAAPFKRFNISWDCFFFCGRGGGSLADWNFWTLALLELVDLFSFWVTKKKKIPSKTWTSVGALRQKLLSSAHASNLLVPDQQAWKTNCKAVHGTPTQRHLWWLPVNIVPFNVRRHQFLFLSFNNVALLFIGALQVHGHFFKKLWWG